MAENIQEIVKKSHVSSVPTNARRNPSLSLYDRTAMWWKAHKKTATLAVFTPVSLAAIGPMVLLVGLGALSITLMAKKGIALAKKSSVLRGLAQWNPKKAISIDILESVVKNVKDEYFSQLKRRTRQLSLGKPFVMLKNKKMVDTYLNRKLYDYIGILYKIRDKVTGRYYYGITRTSMDKRWNGHMTNINARNMDRASLDYFIDDLIRKLLNQGHSYDQAIKIVDNRFERTPVEVAFDIFTLIDREKSYITFAKYNDPKNCFNINYGGALRGVSLIEYVDFTVLAEYLAKGYNLKQIAKVTGMSYSTVYRSVNLVWDGWYDAQDLLLKPVVEALIKKGYDRKYIAAALSGADRNKYKRLEYRLTPETLETWCCERWWTDCDDWKDVRVKFLREIFDSYVIKGFGFKEIESEFSALNYQQIKYRFRKFYKDEYGTGLAAARRILLKPLLEQAFKDRLSDQAIIDLLDLDNWLPFGSSDNKITDVNRLLQRLTEETFLYQYYKVGMYSNRVQYTYGTTPTQVMRNFYQDGFLSIKKP